MQTGNHPTRIHTIVVGGGQAGLAVGYHLARRGIRFLILDAGLRVGDAWRNRWDSLRLFTPARYVKLPGLRFPARGDSFPTKEQMADYLEAYSQRFRLPVRHGLRVDRVSRRGEAFLVSAGSEKFEAENVVVAMANYQKARKPRFAVNLHPGIKQLHSAEYRNPSQLQPGKVLVVGAGNSAAEIAIEISGTHCTLMSGRESGHVPFPIESLFFRFVGIRILRFLGHHILSLATPIGRKLRPKMLHRSAPLVRVKPADLAERGVERVPRVVGVRDGLPLLDDGRTLEVQNVVWCTGYEPGFSWIDLPVFEANGDPLHDRGIVSRAPGLFFVGLHYLYSMTSATIVGVSRDAERVVNAITRRGRSQAAA
ncbi:MAG TPA: NAD(P)/FAD-dependent oxidoreductase [Candidatus Acidoferrum sp.]|nr:NAD(P)/FAD-dependent oxidoreductase [Candidatus Acidoferrum sp.]